MKIVLNCLPQSPSKLQARELIKNAPLSDWLPVLRHLQQLFELPEGEWTRIAEGANALFRLGDQIIVKLVPPNWQYQGEKEIIIAPLLDDKLSLQTPRLLGQGLVDNWIFVISSRLHGCSLADCWPSLAQAQKLSIMRQVGQLLRELRGVEFDPEIAIRVDWSSYIQDLIDACLARHQRTGMPAHLLEQVLPYLAAAGDFALGFDARFMHMDIHPWNLMAEQVQGAWTLTGLLDFGDAIVGNNDRFELLTPMIFMAQGDAALIQALLESYGLLDDEDTSALQRQLMAFALIRPDSNVGFCMQQVPVTGPRDNWEQIARQIFPM